MKKAMKLVWMVLFALPMIAFTACGDDDEPEPEPKVTIGDVSIEYSDLGTAATLEFEVKATNLTVADEVVVTYELNGQSGQATEDQSVYTIALSGLEPGEEYFVNITATAGTASDTQEVYLRYTLLKDYSVLLNKDREVIIKELMKDYTPYYQNLDGIFYDNEDNNLGEYINEVDCYFTFEDIEENPSVVVDDDCIWVDTQMSGLNPANILNYLTALYGKSEVSDDMNSYTFTKGDMYVWYDIDTEEGVCYVGYVNKKSWDDYDKETAQDVRKALKARRAAKRAAR